MKQNKKMSVNKYEPSDVHKLRMHWYKKGYELINITTLCELKMGMSGWCNDFNEPDETCHHIQLWYRGENIAVFQANWAYVIDDDKYVVFGVKDVPGDDFILFRKVKL